MSLFYDPTDSVEPWLPKQLGQITAVGSSTVDLLFKGQNFAGCAVPGGNTAGLSIGDKAALVIPFGATRTWALPDPTEKQTDWNSFADIQYTNHYPKNINEWIARGKMASTALRWMIDKNQKFYRYHEAKVLAFDEAGLGNYARLQSPLLPSDQWYPVAYGKKDAYVSEGDQVLVWRSKYWSSPGEYFVLGGDKPVPVGYAYLSGLAAFTSLFAFTPYFDGNIFKEVVDVFSETLPKACVYSAPAGGRFWHYPKQDTADCAYCVRLSVNEIDRPDFIWVKVTHNSDQFLGKFDRMGSTFPAYEYFIYSGTGDLPSERWFIAGDTGSLDGYIIGPYSSGI